MQYTLRTSIKCQPPALFPYITRYVAESLSMNFGIAGILERARENDHVNARTG